MTTERQQESLVASTRDYMDRLADLSPKDSIKITTGVQIGDNVKRVAAYFPSDWPHVEIIHITDVQWGHILCNEEKFVEYCNWILRSPHRFVVFGGDMID